MENIFGPQSKNLFLRTVKLEQHFKTSLNKQTNKPFPESENTSHVQMKFKSNILCSFMHVLCHIM